MTRNTLCSRKASFHSRSSFYGYLVCIERAEFFTEAARDNLNRRKLTYNRAKMAAKLTNSSRVYKISPKTKTLTNISDSNEHITILCYNEWAVACSFINKDDIIELIGGSISFSDESIICVYDTNKSDSAMTVWRSGFEHVPAMLTHAAVLCSKGNVYLPAWARIYTTCKLDCLEECKHPSLPLLTSRTTTAALHDEVVDDIIDEYNQISSADCKDDDNVSLSGIINQPKKKKKTCEKQSQYSSIAYEYLAQLSDLHPGVVTNLYGVVLEVGNNPMKRYGGNSNHIFMNITLVDPSVLKLIPVDGYTNRTIETLLGGPYSYSDRPSLISSLPTVSLELSTEGDATSLPVISLGDIVRVHRVEPLFSKQRFIDLPHNKHTSIRIWSLYDCNLDELYSKYKTDEDILNSPYCYVNVENAYKVGNSQQNTTFTENDSLRLLKLQRWAYEMFHSFPYFCSSQYTKSLSHLKNSNKETFTKTYGDIIVCIYDILLIPELIHPSQLCFNSLNKPSFSSYKSKIEHNMLCIVVSELKSERNITKLKDKTNFDDLYFVIGLDRYNTGLKDHLQRNKKPLKCGDWVRIRNVSVNPSMNFTYIDDKVIGPFTVIDTHKSRITRLPCWSGDVKLMSLRTLPLNLKSERAHTSFEHELLNSEVISKSTYEQMNSFKNFTKDVEVLNYNMDQPASNCSEVVDKVHFANLNITEGIVKDSADLQLKYSSGTCKESLCSVDSVFNQTETEIVRMTGDCEKKVANFSKTNLLPAISATHAGEQHLANYTNHILNPLYTDSRNSHQYLFTDIDCQPLYYIRSRNRDIQALSVMHVRLNSVPNNIYYMENVNVSFSGNSKDVDPFKPETFVTLKCKICNYECSLMNAASEAHTNNFKSLKCGHSESTFSYSFNVKISDSSGYLEAEYKDEVGMLFEGVTPRNFLLRSEVNFRNHIIQIVKGISAANMKLPKGHFHNICVSCCNNIKEGNNDAPKSPKLTFIIVESYAVSEDQISDD
ncbi:uncharacterized protein CMU_017700 [Cryptosporidium muris RN66]|uniref:Telomeric single stranded DNA binding POT1/Cdc13 domain-containing protein n=1 Tax=Cryptosporidium muris (strain RN66) TaxID=441375 RepID=B6AD12_CRYMR|nr:uncharacterized protein CMU_017700 [Cryptosporidium muris RN66]EEA06016.1 hypothetical protein, conserved [Cryptosporidium muris RN66]|eukprot:XP_002140365.1 hypothetical protein [Cryptosporidium muris RN66]